MTIPFDTENPGIIGKTVLIGVTYFDTNGKETGRGQWWGTILAFNLQQGLLVDLSNSGKRHAFPPIPDAFREAKPGYYELKSSGEVIENPDYLYTIRSDSPVS